MYKMYVQDLCTRYMYEMYKIYEIYKIYERGMKRYETDRRYLNQYGFYNRAKSWQLARNLSL